MELQVDPFPLSAHRHFRDTTRLGDFSGWLSLLEHCTHLLPNFQRNVLLDRSLRRIVYNSIKHGFDHAARLPHEIVEATERFVRIAVDKGIALVG